MKQTLTRLWQKPWGKALIAASYSAVTILVYFALAQIAFMLWNSSWLPSIGTAPAQSQASTISPAEMQKLTQFTPYTGPGSPYYNQAQPTQAAAPQPAQDAAPQAPVQQAPPVYQQPQQAPPVYQQASPASNPQAPDNSALMPPPLPGQNR